MVAGDVSDIVKNSPITKFLNFLGRIPRIETAKQYQQADVFVLPSSAEGSAEVTYEALAAGVPLVVTAAAGSLARDNVEGKLIPERDPNALANALKSIVENRADRNRLATAARLRATDYTWEHYGERLINALTRFENK